ncbi:MAG: hypothetical protein PVI71_18175 [Desulfobacterales bacterium]|jgi:hypothetical protein
MSRKKFAKDLEKRTRQFAVRIIKICESESSETQLWLEVITDVEWLKWEEVKSDYDECSEPLALLTPIGSK